MLLLVAVSAGLPFIVFGFSDNAIMVSSELPRHCAVPRLHACIYALPKPLMPSQILAGDEIESTFGARLGLSTLAAAGLGNLLSDLVGLAMAEPVQV